ncbi:PilZ domain-containing protein [Desulfobacterales bacterium HSG17]|nr:PilZ domain-containing protein [Desulfobacterales bacterium HSG17]
MQNEKRKFTRVNSLFLSYICIDEEGKTLNEGIGRTLNVSEGGILLETNFNILPEHNLLITIAVEDNLVDVKGKVIRCWKNEEDNYHTGVEFIDIDESALNIIIKFINLFKENKLA